MDRQDDINEPVFAYSGDAAYLEDLYAKYQANPETVDGEWGDFFAGLDDDKAVVARSARGASWKKANWPIASNGELVSALDGNWGLIEKAVGEKIKAKAEVGGVPVSPAAVQQATRDSVRAIMLIRAYRMRGHLHAPRSARPGHNR